MSLQCEVGALRRIAEKSAADGAISRFIHSFRPGMLVVDLYSRRRELEKVSCEWDVDAYAREMLILEYSSPDQFRRIYRFARLLRGRSHSRLIN
ncbi:hypothetical protein ABRP77_04615 [Pectobacterium odoriferum]|uniref:hypothetical protein n=1 Tax=Pectobacterium odoriferum TaxID=78398 RepID=UPI0032EFF4F1